LDPQADKPTPSWPARTLVLTASRVPAETVVRTAEQGGGKIELPGREPVGPIVPLVSMLRDAHLAEYPISPAVALPGLGAWHDGAGGWRAAGSIGSVSAQ